MKTFATTHSSFNGMVTYAESVDVSSEDFNARLTGNIRKCTTAGIYIATGGNISITLIGGSDPVIYTVPDNYQLNVQAITIHNTGTTASGIIAQY